MWLKKAFDSVFSPPSAPFERVGAVDGPQEAKASRTARLIALANCVNPVWSPRDYAALAREGYGRNPVVYRCIRMISEAAASVPLGLFAGDREVLAHPLLSLLASPGGGQSGAQFLESVYGHLLGAGNAYLEQVSVEGAPRELHALRPDRIKPVLSASGWVEAYDYSVAGRTLRLAAEPPEGEGVAPLRHLKLFHPLNDHYGFAPIEAAQVSLDIHNAASSWNKALLDNAARPSGALVYGAGDALNLAPDQFDRLKQELEAGYQGARNAGRPLLLEGGLDWKPMGLTPKDMDFIEAKNQAAREIALAFGVPPMLLGIPGDNTYANYREANLAFWRACVLPLVLRSAAALTDWLAPAWPSSKALRLVPDLDAVEALSAEREALWRRVGEADFLSLDEKRMAVGYGRADPSPSDPMTS